MDFFELLDDFTQLKNNANIYSNDLSENLSAIDKKINDNYHEIEFHSFGTVQAHKLLSELQYNLRMRRSIKEKKSMLDSMQTSLNKINDHVTKNSYNKKYQSNYDK